MRRNQHWWCRSKFPRFFPRLSPPCGVFFPILFQIFYCLAALLEAHMQVEGSPSLQEWHGSTLAYSPCGPILCRFESAACPTPAAEDMCQAALFPNSVFGIFGPDNFRIFFLPLLGGYRRPRFLVLGALYPADGPLDSNCLQHLSASIPPPK